MCFIYFVFLSHLFPADKYWAERPWCACAVLFCSRWERPDLCFLVHQEVLNKKLQNKQNFKIITQSSISQGYPLIFYPNSLHHSKVSKLQNMNFSREHWKPVVNTWKILSWIHNLKAIFLLFFIFISFCQKWTNCVTVSTFLLFCASLIHFHLYSLSVQQVFIVFSTCQVLCCVRK